MKKIIIFGSNGFLGTHLKEKLEDEIVGVNIRQQNWKETVPKSAEVFINCIGKAHDHMGTATVQDFYYANDELVKVLFEKFLKSDAQLFIHISSIAAVEENERWETITEKSDCRPVSFYGKSKRAAEKFLLNQTIPDGKKIIILRPTMIHGEGDKGNLKLLYAIIARGIPYPLGSYKNSRSFTAADNVAFVIDEIIKQKSTVTSGLYNLCDDMPLSTARVIEIIGKVRGKKPHILLIPRFIINTLAKVGDITSLPFNSKRLIKMTSNLVVSNAKIKSALGIERLPISAEDGVEKTIKSFSEKQ